ncbi:MAG: terminase large subunit domain-containing protein [Methylobacter sp.]
MSLIKLHPKQHEVFHHKSRYKVVAAGRRWGKSLLSQVSLIDKAIERPGSLNWYVAPSYRMAKQIMWDPINRMIPAKWLKKKPNETAMRIELINHSVIELKGADNPDSLRGVGIDYLVMDEMQDIRPGAWSAVLRPTLLTTMGDVLFIGTSKSYNHFYDLWVLGNNGDPKYRDWKSWQFKTISSPFVTAAEIRKFRDEMDPKTFRQELEASFEAISGRVYYPFDRKLHVGDYPFNPKLPIHIGQDFNIDPMSSAIFQIQPNGEVWAVDEIVLFSSNTQETCEEIERRYWRHMNQISIYPDPAGGARQHARGETDLDIFREKGFKRIFHHRKHPAIADRVNSVNKMLLTAEGTVRMRIDKRCKHLIDSFERTIYKEGGREVDKSLSVEHQTDASGYFLQYRYPARKIEVAGISL